MSPVGRSGFSFPAGRRVTSPSTEMFHSGLSFSAAANTSPTSGWKVTWVTPQRSLKSTKMSPPWSRRRFTQPASFTRSPAFRARNSPAVCVL